MAELELRKSQGLPETSARECGYLERERRRDVPLEVQATSPLPRIDSSLPSADDPVMIDVIYPRSPRETMDGWIHLPRYIDKIRLHLAGKLHPDYQPNLGKGFDAKWCAAADVTHEQMIEVVKHSLTDGEVCEWVRRHVKKSADDKTALRDSLLNYPQPQDQAMQDRLKMRKEQAGLAQRDDIRSFVDFIDADEQRL